VSGGGAQRGKQQASLIIISALLQLINEGRYNMDGLRRKVAAIQAGEAAADSGDTAPAPKRTIHRYLERLRNAGFPVVYENGVYQFAPGYVFGRLHLDESQAAQLVLLQSTARNINIGIGGNIEELISQFLSQNADPATEKALQRYAFLDLRLPKTDMEPRDRETLELVRKAMVQHQRLRFRYVDKFGNVSHRDVNPYGCRISEGRVYLFAYDNDKRAIRIFAIDNISSVEISPHRFGMPPDFDIARYGQDSLSGLYDNDADRQQVVVYVRKEVAKHALARTRGVRHDAVQREDGGAEITFLSPQPDEIIEWAFGYGPAATIVGPPEMVQRATTLLAQMQSAYAAHLPRRAASS